MEGKKEQDKKTEKEQKILEKTKESLEKQKTMKISIKEGSAASVMSGLGDSYISPFALAIGANNLQIGFLSSFTGLLGPLSQLAGTKLMEKYSRKKIIVTAVALNGLMWFPILFLSLFFWKNLFTQYLPVILIIFYSIYAIFGSLGSPAWFSLLGDIVPENHRGKYFGIRNKICGIVALLTMLAGAFVLDYYKTRGYLLLIFSIFFFIAGISRLISAYLFTKHYYPKLKLEKGYYFSLFQFIKKAPENNFGRFTIYVSLLTLAVNIAGPFFTVYMLKDLGFSYITFILVNASASVFSLLTMTVWGKLSDMYGNREMLKFGSILVSLIPILWILSKNPIYLIFIPQLVSGIGWAAFNLAASNFIYDSVTPQRRGICVAYYNLLNGLGVFMGAALGGFLANYLTISFMNKLLFIFLVSGILRIIVSFIMMPKIKEVRQKVAPPRRNPLSYLKEMKNIKEIRPIREVFEGISSISSTLIQAGIKAGRTAGKKGMVIFE